MIPLGTRVTVTAVRDGGNHAARKLIGRTGIVTEHIDDDSPNAVAGLQRLERFLGVWCFRDDELTPDHDTQPDSDTAGTADGEDGGQVVMRFLTHGGAAVELHTQTFRKPHNSHRDDDGRWVHDWRDATGFNWRCTGCHTRGENHGHAYDEPEPRESRTAANHHADRCRAMPPTTHRP